MPNGYDRSRPYPQGLVLFAVAFVALWVVMTLVRLFSF